MALLPVDSAVRIESFLAELAAYCGYHYVSRSFSSFLQRLLDLETYLADSHAFIRECGWRGLKLLRSKT